MINKTTPRLRDNVCEDYPSGFKPSTKSYVLEMKYSKDEGQSEILLAQAIAQIRHKHYPERYLRDRRRCLLLAVAVSGKEVSYALEPQA